MAPAVVPPGWYSVHVVREGELLLRGDYENRMHAWRDALKVIRAFIVRDRRDRVRAK